MQDLDVPGRIMPPRPRVQVRDEPLGSCDHDSSPVVVSTSRASTEAVANLAVALLSSNGRPVGHSVVLVIGMRAAPDAPGGEANLLDVINILQQAGADVAYHDSCTPLVHTRHGGWLRSVEEPLPPVDLVILDNRYSGRHFTEMPEAPLVLSVG